MMELTNAALAAAIGVSERRVAAVRGEGRLPLTEAGRIDGNELLRRGWDASLAETRQDEPTGLEANRARESKLRGDRLDLINRQLRSELIAADEVEAIVGGVVDGVRAKILAVPSSVAPRVAISTDPIAVREMLTEAVHDALRELSQGEIVSTVKERARRGALGADFADLVMMDGAGA